MDQRRLLKDLLSSFDEAGFRALCRRIGVASAELKGWNRADKSASLVRAMSRAGNLDQLAGAMAAERPDLNRSYSESDQLAWIDSVATGRQRPVDEEATLEWPESKGIEGTAIDRPPEEGLPVSPVEELPTLAWPAAPAKWPRVHGGSAADNPFRAGGLLRQESMFYGRSSERAQILARLLRMVSVAVTGSRRIGKSWLCRYVADYERIQADAKLLFANIDGARSDLTMTAQFFDGSLAGWYGQLLDAAPPTAGTPQEFTRQLRTLASAGYRPILLVDGLDFVMDRMSGELVDVLTAWRNGMNSGHLALLVTARQPLSLLSSRFGLGEPFKESFWNMTLGQLDEGDARALVKEPIVAGGNELPDGVLDFVISLCGRHPYDLQLGAALLYEALHTGEFSRSRLAAQFMVAAEPHWREIWDSLTPIQRMALAQPLDGGVPKDMRESFASLIRLGLLVEGPEGTSYYSRGFADRIGALVAQKG